MLRRALMTCRIRAGAVILLAAGRRRRLRLPLGPRQPPADDRVAVTAQLLTRQIGERG